MKQPTTDDTHYRKQLRAWQRQWCAARKIRRVLKEAGFNPFVQLRMQMGVFQDWLAIELGITKHHLSRIERGQREPSDQLLAKLLRIHKVWEQHQ